MSETPPTNPPPSPSPAPGSPDPGSGQGEDAAPASGVRFDPEATHHRSPRLRPVRGFPLEAKNPQGEKVSLLGLADARQISSKMVATHPAAQAILGHMDGTKSIDEIVAVVGRGLTREFMENLVAQLDDAGLIHGPRFEAMVEKMRTDYDSLPHLPPGSTAQFIEAVVQQERGSAQAGEESAQDPERAASLDPGVLRSRFESLLDEWMDEAVSKLQGEPIGSMPGAISVPHIDYSRGWQGYAAVWGQLRGLARPDRVVILGTNHFGDATGVCGCDKGFESPLGICPLDESFVDALRTSLGPDRTERLFEHRFDHEREHSIELQIPWIQRAFGEDAGGGFCPVFAALVHDPAVNNGEPYDGQGVGLEPFIEALREAIRQSPGTTLVVSSADLSHVGPAFGDQQRTADPENDESARAFREKTAQHDQEMLKLLTEGKAEELVAAMAWQQNPTRWCSTGNLVAAMRATESTGARLIHYGAAVDQQGMSMVSSAGLEFVRG